MKKLASISMLLALAVAFIGCDKAKEVAEDVKNKAADAANVDFGDFDFDGLKEKLGGITEGFSGVSADNVDGLTSKITEFTGSLEGMGIGKLEGAAKTAVTTLLSGATETIKKAMEGISDDSILAKLKPVVETLMEKLAAYK